MTGWVLTAESDAATVRRWFDRLEADLEDMTAPLSIHETDEDAGRWAVTVYADDDTVEDVARAVLEACPDADLVRSRLPDRDWVTASLEGLSPVRAGGFLVHGSHDRAARRSGETAIEIEAGQAFGTGHHGTTAGCLEALDRILRAGPPGAMLDLGTGSGVLAIAMALRTKRLVMATDIDPIAVRVARENAKLNGVAGQVRTVVSADLSHEAVRGRAPYDLIVANILARPLERLSHGIASAAAPNCTLVLSGLLVRQRRRVLASYRQHGFAHRRTIERDGWATLTLSRGR